MILAINGIDSTKFSQFLNRIVDKIDTNSENIFSDEEKLKLKSIFSSNSLEKIDSIIKTIHNLFKRIVYQLIKPKNLTKELTELGLETEKVVLFVDLWNSCASDLVDKLKDKSFELSENRLSSIDWSLKLLSQQNSSADHNPIPLAQIGLTLTNGSTGGQTNQNISIDFDRKELWNLYENLEEIQTQLDSLHK